MVSQINGSVFHRADRMGHRGGQPASSCSGVQPPPLLAVAAIIDRLAVVRCCGALPFCRALLSGVWRFLHLFIIIYMFCTRCGLLSRRQTEQQRALWSFGLYLCMDPSAVLRFLGRAADLYTADPRVRRPLAWLREVRSDLPGAISVNYYFARRLS